jgi:hypothetical protein
MLQREMDSTVDYAVPLVKPKKSFLEKLINTKAQLRLKNKIPVIRRKVTDGVSDQILDSVSTKASTWGQLRYLGRLGMPAQILSIVVIGTLLGAAYAVTMQTANRQLVEEGGAVVNNISASRGTVSRPEQISALAVMQVEPKLQPQEAQQESIFQQLTPEVASLKQDAIPSVESKATEFTLKNTTEVDLMLSLNATVDNLPKAITPSETISSKESTPGVAAEKFTDSGLNKYDRKRIKELKQKIFAVRQKAEEYDQRNLRLEGKLELLTVKNRALSERLRQLDKINDLLRRR